MKNLTEFKKYLAHPDASLRMVALEWFRDNEWVSVPVKNPNYRGVAKLQTNAVALADEDGKKSWLYFGNASEWLFDNSTNLAVNLSGGCRITYKWANIAIVDEPSQAEQDKQFIDDHFKVIMV